jgi:hypothetical protein
MPDTWVTQLSVILSITSTQFPRIFRLRGIDEYA